MACRRQSSVLGEKKKNPRAIWWHWRIYSDVQSTNNPVYVTSKWKITFYNRTASNYFYLSGNEPFSRTGFSLRTYVDNQSYFYRLTSFSSYRSLRHWNRWYIDRSYIYTTERSFPSDFIHLIERLSFLYQWNSPSDWSSCCSAVLVNPIWSIALHWSSF